ncbi:hypothetical protein F5878DRAFT_623797 [Lentinula raphanica]|uniref:Uncharacterized protein n=1 Tax=Lentinula raphanica TaxID=153919 RepID=A0AA38P6G5_9AGAR|nr:hypothetical protein F5880DRAFT_1566114 [Lentinula raphanica]KAJ3836968.1 hypothetical protein F5878DRAFT_623797 [Lentinula raphanica]
MMNSYPDQEYHSTVYDKEKPDSNWSGPRGQREYTDRNYLAKEISREQFEMLKLLEAYEVHSCEELEPILEKTRESVRAGSKSASNDPSYFAYASGFSVSGGSFEVINGDRTVMNPIRMGRWSTPFPHAKVSVPKAPPPPRRAEFSSRSAQYAADASPINVERRYGNQNDRSQANNYHDAFISPVGPFTEGGGLRKKVELTGPSAFAFSQNFGLDPDTTLSPGAFSVVEGNQHIDIVE